MPAENQENCQSTQGFDKDCSFADIKIVNTFT